MSIAEQMKGLFAVVVAVNDLDEAIKSYQKLGFELTDRSAREEWGLEAAQFQIGDGMIELLAPVAENRQVAQAVRSFLDKRGEGVYEVAIRVADIDAVNSFIKGKGARIVAEPHSVPTAPERRLMWVSPRSTHGVALEFIT